MEAKAITPKEVKDLIERGQQVTLIDVRNDQAWSESDKKLPGALRLRSDEALARADEIPKDGIAITYCT
jgi:rhodanese-related sulfurtransferase